MFNDGDGCRRLFGVKATGEWAHTHSNTKFIASCMIMLLFCIPNQLGWRHTQGSCVAPGGEPNTGVAV